MSVKKFLISAALCGHLMAVENVELLADDVKKNGDIIEVLGNVVLYSKTYFVTAKRAVYNQKDEIVELFDDVNMMRGSNEISRANYAKIDLKTDKVSFENIFSMDKDKEIWIKSKDACNDDEKSQVSGSVVSSCNVQDPDWSIRFSKGELNKKSKFLHLYNPIFYVKNIPVLYLPYFGFSTDKTRRTGFLTPDVGYRRGEGFYYAQPIYFAPQSWWDLEITPQVRTRRGQGIYATLRFVDSLYSKGLIRAGVFKEKEKYALKEKLKNKKHSGFEIEYDRDKLLKYLIDGDFKEGLWLRYTYLNDIDYLNLKTRRSGDYNSLVASKFNYFVSTDEHYAGLYARYYIDTSKIGTKYENDNTLQELPSLQYHKFTNSILFDNLTYSFDASMHNYTRKKGVRATQYEVSIPILATFPILNDYLNFSIGQDFYATNIKYQGKLRYERGKFYEDKDDSLVRSYTKLNLTTDLFKPYDSFLHTINGGISYTRPSFKRGNLDKELVKNYLVRDGVRPNSNQLEENFLLNQNTISQNENVALNLTQFFYNQDGKKRFRHSIKQYYDIDEREFGDLENRINLYLDNFTFGNKLSYSHKDNKLNKIQTSINYSNQNLSLGINHTYENLKTKRASKTYDKESYLNLNFRVKLPKNYAIFGQFEYDLERDYTKMWKAGVNYKRKCWDYTFAYRENIEPKNTSAGVASKKTQGFYLFFNFYPLGGVGYDYSIEHEN